MRVLIAYDGSQGAEYGLSLATTLAWPPDSTLRVVAVADYLGVPIGRGPAIPSPELETQIVAHFEDVMADATNRLESTRIADHVEGAVLRGRPATVLVDEAVRFGADLVVGGSRGHGPIASLVLGSVSSEFVDHAPCPALVARTSTVTRVVFATDGSNAAAVAEDVLARWGLFDRLPIEVVSVADVVAPWHTGISPVMYSQVIASHADDLDRARATHGALAEEAAERLRAAGRTATANVRTGDAASEIIAVATETAADLIVIGSRGRTGLTRVLLGSVARNVLHASAASVLVVREPAGA